MFETAPVTDITCSRPDINTSVLECLLLLTLSLIVVPKLDKNLVKLSKLIFCFYFLFDLNSIHNNLFVVSFQVSQEFMVDTSVSNLLISS